MARAFKIHLKEGDKARFYDNLDTPIPEAVFANVLKTFHSGSCFFVNVVFKIERDTPPTVITPFVRNLYTVNVYFQWLKGCFFYLTDVKATFFSKA